MEIGSHRNGGYSHSKLYRFIYIPLPPLDFSFSALHEMPARTSDEKGVCPSVCLLNA